MTDVDPAASIAIVEPSYPALTGLARHGAAVAWVVTAVVFLAVSAIGYPLLGSRSLVVASVVAVLAYAGITLLGDIARLLVDTLIPK
jgi:hypothetical protein